VGPLVQIFCPLFTANQSPREDDQADNREGYIPREICLQAKQTLFKLVPINPQDESLPWTSEYPIPNEKDFLCERQSNSLRKMRNSKLSWEGVL
jgi:hypothetical protein